MYTELLVWFQIQHYRRCAARFPLEWYETRRKTTHVVFWS